MGIRDACVEGTLFHSKFSSSVFNIIHFIAWRKGTENRMHSKSWKQFGALLVLMFALIMIVDCNPPPRQRPRRYRSGIPIQNRLRTVRDEDELIRDLGQILVTNRTAVIRFYADWCPVCQSDAPAFLRLVERFPGTVFFKVDVDKHPRLISEYGIRAVPTYFILRRETRHLTFHSARDVENVLRRR